MKSNLEYERRCRAIRLLSEGVRFKEVLHEVQRGRFWLSKWICRYEAFGLDGLRDRSRTPKHIRNRTRVSIVQKILDLRDELAAYRTRRAAFAGIGAETIHHELYEQGIRRLPAISTIEKILARAGKTKKVKVKRTPGGPPYPYVRAQKMGDLQQTDLVGPRHLRGPSGVIRFYSFHTIDVGPNSFGPSVPGQANALLARSSP